MTLPATPPKQGLARPLTGLGIFCIVIGCIFALPSGLCVSALIAVIAYTLTEGMPFREFLEDGLPMLIVGLVPLVVGVALIWVGFKQRRDRG